MAEHGALISQGEVMRNAYKILVGQLEGKKHLLAQMAELYKI
jgi:hypothetical protein